MPHILTEKISCFVIRFLNHIFFVINFFYFVIRFLLNTSIVKSDNEIGKVNDKKKNPIWKSDNEIGKFWNRKKKYLHMSAILWLVNVNKLGGTSLFSLLELAPNPIPMPIPITTSTMPVIISALTVLENPFQHSQKRSIFSQLLNLQEECWRFLKHIKWLSWNDYIQFWWFDYSNLISS